MATRRTIIGRHALMLAAKGEKEIAAQVFDYTKIREIRVDLHDFEVKILTTFDDSFYRVLKVEIDSSADAQKKEEAEKILLRFYNDLLNATMRFSKEDIQQLMESNARNQKILSDKQKKSSSEEQQTAKLTE